MKKQKMPQLVLSLFIGISLMFSGCAFFQNENEQNIELATDASTALSTTTTTTASTLTTTTTTTKFASTTTSSTTKLKKTTTKPSCPPTEPGHKHSFITRVIEPDCQEGGYTRYTCTCGYTYTDNPTPKVSHRSRWIMDAASTPTEEGLIRHYCEFCGKTLREEVIPKKKNPYNIDSRVEIEKMRWTNEPVYVYKDTRVIDGRTWGEAPIIEILEDDSLKVTYYTRQGEKVVLTVEQPENTNCLNKVAISNDGTYICKTISSFS